MRRALILLCLIAGCGDNLLPDGQPLRAGHDLVIVAHEDDDLLFMQPDVIEAVRAGGGVTLVYVTAGNGTAGVDAAEKRYEGLRQAYAAAAGGGSWDCGWIAIDGHAAEHCALDRPDEGVSLVFLGYPDGGKQGEYTSSLLHLWEGVIRSADTIADRPATYDRDGLIDTLAEIIRTVGPRTIHTLEVAATHGRDHSDHMIVGALAVLATARAGSDADLISYRGYDTANEDANKIDPIYADVFPVLSHYEACVSGCGPCGGVCDTIDASHATWLHRRYAVGFRARAKGRLQSGDQCVMLDQTLGPCDGAPIWTLGADRTVKSGSACLGDCGAWFLDDEGHLWSGAPPAPAANMDYAHLDCLGADAKPALCGADLAPTWTFAPETVTTPIPAALATAPPATLRLADLSQDGYADLCAVVSGELVCALGDGAGGFGEAGVVQELPVDPGSLMIADLDACGRDASGIRCLHEDRFTNSFGDGDAVAGTDASLAIVDRKVCGLGARGYACARPGEAAVVVSGWPTAPAWPAELDGDGAPDWCATDGVACAVAAEAPVTTDGAPWAFSLNATVDAPDPATAAVGDVDGDGRDDLCALDAGRVACARSQGRGFGPRATIAVTPGGTTLLLGDLDGDGASDPCVVGAGSIVCARP